MAKSAHGHINSQNSGSTTAEPGISEGSNARSKTGRCHSCKASCYRLCLPCSAKHNKPLNDATRSQRFKYTFTCPPHGLIGKFLTLAIVGILLWAVLWSMVGADVLPGGNIYSIVILFIGGTIGGYVSEFCRLPSLLGMLLMGILLANVPLPLGIYVLPSWSSAIRKIALVVILIRAGLGMNLDVLRQQSWVIARVALFPMAVEATAAALAMRYILNFPWDWAFMQGFVLCAVSAAVAIPFMLLFQSEGYGVVKGIPTTLMAAASIDNVTAISAFSIVLGIRFSSGELAFTIIKGPLQLVLGLLVGALFGGLLWYFPHKQYKYKTIFRCVILFGICLLSVFGSSVADFSAAGPLGCLIIALVAAYKWRKQGWVGKENPMPVTFSHFWTVFQILLFSLVGALIDIKQIDFSILGKGVGVIFIGLVCRLIIIYFSLFGSIMNKKERLFAVFTWLPKATVQAAIGSLAFDRAVLEGADDIDIQRGRTILTIAIVAVVITSPVGAAAVALSGPRLLQRDKEFDLEASVVVDEVGDDDGDDDDDNENDDKDKNKNAKLADNDQQALKNGYVAVEGTSYVDTSHCYDNFSYQRENEDDIAVIIPRVIDNSRNVTRL